MYTLTLISKKDNTSLIYFNCTEIFIQNALDNLNLKDIIFRIVEFK
jgi:hypothetical protein